MPIHAHCPSCQKRYVLADTLDGKCVRCQECQQPFRVRGDSPSPAPEGDAAGDAWLRCRFGTVIRSE